MIYAIDNREAYEENRQIFFVEAPASFEDWFRNQLVPWQTAVLTENEGMAWFAVHAIICVASEARFDPDCPPITVAAYLSKNAFVPEIAQLAGLPLVPYVEGVSYNTDPPC